MNIGVTIKDYRLQLVTLKTVEEIDAVLNEIVTVQLEFDPDGFPGFCISRETVWKGRSYLIDDKRNVKVLEQRAKKADDLLFGSRVVRKTRCQFASQLRCLDR